MKNDKNLMRNKAMVGGLITLIITGVSRYMYDIYGHEDGSKITVVVTSVMAMFVGAVIIYLAIKKYYIAAVLILAMLIPSIIAIIGVYKNNMCLAAIGVFLMMVNCILGIKFCNEYKKRHG